jgi:hypothetical protein
MGEVAFLRQQRVRRAEGLEGSLGRWSSLLNLVWRVRDGQDEQRLEALQRELIETAGRARDFQTRGPTWKYPNAQIQALGLAQIWIRSSWQMAQLCRARGIEYYHFLQPNQYVEGSKPLSDEERRLSFDGEHRFRPWVIEGYPALVAEGQRAAAEGLPFWDLSQIFQAIPDTLYIDSCCHFNDQGNVVLAQHIARLIAANPGPPPLPFHRPSGG